MRHKKRGSVYTVVGQAEVQASNGPLQEGEAVAVYRGDDGKLWVRRVAEFEDGRFENVPDKAELTLDDLDGTWLSKDGSERRSLLAVSKAPERLLPITYGDHEDGEEYQCTLAQFLKWVQRTGAQKEAEA